MKLDVIEVLDDGLLGEFSDIYLIKIGKHSNFFPIENTKPFVLNNLLKSYDEYQYVEYNYFKSLKRIFSIKLQESKIKNKKILIKLIDFFNGPIGKLNKIMSNIILIQTLLENKFKKPNINVIQFNIKHNIDMLNGQLKNMLDKTLHITSIKKLNNNLENIRKKIFNNINFYSLQFQKENKNILPF
jgi:hypothetical protein